MSNTIPANRQVRRRQATATPPRQIARTRGGLCIRHCTLAIAPSAAQAIRQPVACFSTRHISPAVKTTNNVPKPYPRTESP